MVFEKFGVLCFLVMPVLRFALYLITDNIPSLNFNKWSLQCIACITSQSIFKLLSQFNFLKQSYIILCKDTKKCNIRQKQMLTYVNWKFRIRQSTSLENNLSMPGRLIKVMSFARHICNLKARIIVASQFYWTYDWNQQA